MSDFVSRPGHVCEGCGSPELRIIAPGDAMVASETGIMLQRPRADRTWCGPDCASAAGWPFLSFPSARRQRAAAPEAAQAADVRMDVSSPNSGAVIAAAPIL